MSAATPGPVAPSGGAHAPYFERLSVALREAGIAQACIVIDLPRLRANLAAIGAHAQTGMALRGVLKSLPSLELMDELAQAWNSHRVMAFNAAQLQQFLQARLRMGMPAQMLLGKPLPVAAAAQVLQALPPEVGSRIEWLVDTQERLAQYRALAEQRAQTLRINLEIDVGLHRGGFEDAAQLGEALSSLKSMKGSRLEWSGFMGYDAHAAAVPRALGMRQRALEESKRRYEAAFAVATAALGPLDRDRLTLNTAGSPTFRLHDGRGIPNEVSVGSAALMPLDFEKPPLADLQAAAFIATPVLKVWPEFRMPEGVTWLSRLARAVDPRQAQALAIHGGHWLAQVASPAGVRPSGLFGHSSNQQVMVTGRQLMLRPDDYVFLRPQQSEAVLLQFGDLIVFDGQHISARWPVLPASA